MSRKRIARLRRMRQAAGAGHDPRITFPVPSGRDVTPHTQRKEVSATEVKFHPPAPHRSAPACRELRDRTLWERDASRVDKEFSR